MEGKCVLVTGGTGYIGSHTVLCLLDAGASVVIVDNLVNSSEAVLLRVAELASPAAAGRVTFCKADLVDKEELEKVFVAHKFDAVIHFAGLKAVGESVAKPQLYYSNNLVGTLVLLDAMSRHGCKTIVFSSSATVYGDPASVPITESFPLSATNPYGRTKLFIEEMLRDVYIADSAWTIILLRYFNPVGAHPSGRLGEDPAGIPNNLMPYIQQVAVGRREKLTIYGDDYPTVDGTGVRDYIHVVDLAEGHVAALRKAFSCPSYGCKAINLGTGTGTSVVQMLHAFEAACGKKLPHAFAPRRPGDVASCYAATAMAEEELGWRATRDVAQMCKDQWAWASANPYGYGTAP